MPRASCALPWKKTCVAVIVCAIFIQYSYAEDIDTLRRKRQNCRRNQYPCNSGGCVDVFQVCDGFIHCVDGSDEVADVCRAKRCPSQAFTCDYGACIDLDLVCDGVKQCADGSDEKPASCSVLAARPIAALPPRIDNFPKITCPPFIMSSLEISCKLNNNDVDCEKPVPPGTVATVSCQQFYTSKEFSRFNTVCEPNGRWSKEAIPCTPKCGEPNPDGLPFISGGTPSKYGEYPWHAGVYKLIDGVYKQICGGNIISERVVVSASHCFWDAVNSKKDDPSLFKIAVGKYYRNWDANGKYVQTIEIEKVVLHNRFRGELRKWQNDIALIVLKDEIKMTIAVRPICLDLKREFDQYFKPGKRGIVVGWGIRETMRPSEELYTTNLPYVSFEDCEKEVPKSFLPFLSEDKFCAGYRNGTSVCPGDGGGGFATRYRDGRWYLVGLASLGLPPEKGDTCNIYQYATFIRVLDYYDFIEDNLPKGSR